MSRQSSASSRLRIQEEVALSTRPVLLLQMAPSIREREHHDESDSPSQSKLRDRYEELKALRLTQPEREAQAARKTLEKHTKAADALVASLRAQLAAAGGTEAPPPPTPADDSAKLREENAELKRQLAANSSKRWATPPALEEAEAKVSFYELMTGMKIEVRDGLVAQCQVQCLAEDDDSTQRRAAFDFHLSPEGADEGDVEYVPTDLSQACPEKLPGYMREPITFEKEQAPIFLSRLVKMMAEA